MLDLNHTQLLILVAGSLITATGVGGLLPTLLRFRHAFGRRETAVHPSQPSAEEVRDGRIRDKEAFGLSSEAPSETVQAASEELTAKIFSIRMLVSDLAAELQAIRETVVSAYERSDEDEEPGFGESIEPLFR